MSSVPSHPPTSAASATALEPLTRELRVSIAALRASLESFIDQLGPEDPRIRTLDGALSEVSRISRQVHALVDYARPAPLAPLWCSAEEIALAAIRALQPDQGRRIQTSSIVATRLLIDGPVLARCLFYLLESALSESDAPVTLDVGRENGRVDFHVRGPLARPAPGDPRVLAVAVLGARLAERDVVRMGGRLTYDDESSGRLGYSIGVPAGPAEDTQ